jgi:hypothetical protein
MKQLKVIFILIIELLDCNNLEIDEEVEIKTFL